MTDERLTTQIVTEALRDADAEMVATILATEATIEEFEEALAWASGESDVMAKLGRPVAGRVAAVYQILTAGDDMAEDRR